MYELQNDIVSFLEFEISLENKYQTKQQLGDIQKSCRASNKMFESMI